MNLPSREECESWETTQVAFFLNKNQMEECAGTVIRLRINGHRFLNMSDVDVSKFSPLQQPQLQKIVQDIRKNDGSLLDKLRRLKSKPLPKVPARDYRGGTRESDEDLSGSDYDNDTWNEPPFHNGEYEPPPSHRDFSLPQTQFHQSEYLDGCRDPPERPPKKAFRSCKELKPLPSQPAEEEDTDGDYISPDGGTDEENYIQPTEGPAADCYEVPEMEENSMTSSTSRLHPTIMSLPLPPKPSPRLHRKTSPSRGQRHAGDGAFDDSDEDRPHRLERRQHVPPKPRHPERSPKLPCKPQRADARREPEIPSLLIQHTDQKPSPTLFSLDLKRPMIPLPPFSSLRRTERNSGTDQDKEAGVREKPWFSSTCDRKTAGDAVSHSNKDGAFLVRKSSGHDAQQPYTLVVFYNGHVYNIPIRFIESTQKYALGSEKKGEEYFNSVAHIIENHQRNPLVLIDSQNNSKDAALLSYPVTL
ncbi:B-cell linker protein isoform X1 [Synchiropus splendidus]|uniref:B-cell linker protein isoform X1 n=1 Tax=Synchiropus splendidus TaxID=270530 RepID=UPI00237E261E|nr:B-cell linker protein isoform X1 [Synchiropus splendidus]